MATLNKFIILISLYLKAVLQILLLCKILTPRIKKIEAGTRATGGTLRLIFQRVLQTPFVGFMGDFSGCVACFGDSRVFKHNLTDLY